MSNFRTIDRETPYLLPPSVDEWLPEPHFARFIVEVIDSLNLGRMSGANRGSGSASYQPRRTNDNCTANLLATKLSPTGC